MNTSRKCSAFLHDDIEGITVMYYSIIDCTVIRSALSQMRSVYGQITVAELHINEVFNVSINSTFFIMALML